MIIKACSRFISERFERRLELNQAALKRLSRKSAILIKSYIVSPHVKYLGVSASL
jgi:hypothetical protein